MIALEIKIEKECMTCEFRHHLGNRCMYANFGCKEHYKDYLPKWKLHDNYKLSLIKKIMDA